MKKSVFLLLIAFPLLYGCGSRDEVQPKKTEVKLIGQIGGNYTKAECLIWRERDGKDIEGYSMKIVGNNVETAIFAESGDVVYGSVNLIDEGVNVKDFLSAKLIVNGKVVASQEYQSAQVLTIEYQVP